MGSFLGKRWEYDESHVMVLKLTHQQAQLLYTAVDGADERCAIEDCENMNNLESYVQGEIDKWMSIHPVGWLREWTEVVF